VKISTRNHYYANRAVAELGLRQFKEATRDINSAIHLDPRNTQFYCTRAWIRMGVHNWKDAIDDWNQVIAHDPKDTKALAARADCFVKVGNHHGQLGDYNRLAKLNQKEKNPYFLVTRAKLEMQLANYPQAIGDFSKAIAFNLNNKSGKLNRRHVIFARMSRAKCYEKMGQFAKAVLDYDKLILRNHDSSKTVALYMKRGSLLSKCFSYKLAEADFEKAIALKPKLAQAHLARAIVRAKERLYPQALADAHQAVALAPHSNEAKQVLAQISQLKKHSDTAFLKDIAVDPDDNILLGYSGKTSKNGSKQSTAQASLAGGYQRLLNNDPQGAIRQFEQVAKRSPNDANARRYLAYALSQAGRYEEAVAQFSALKRLAQPLTTADEIRFAKALAATGAPSRSADLLQQSLAANPGNAQYRPLIEMYTAQASASSKADSQRRASQPVLLPARMHIGG